MALATTMHEVNDKQKNRVDAKGLEHISMLSLIEKALAEKTALDAGKITVSELSHSSYELLNFEEKLVQLLQARHNFILATIVAKMSNVDKSLKNKVKLGVLSMDWTLDLAKLNDVEVAELKRYTKAVLDTRAILTRAGHPIEVDETIMKIMKNGQWAAGKAKALVRQSVENDLRNYLTQIKNAKVELK
ncbi:hypothetical protein [Bdellovibrio bacteriovorus]|uniref:hypothetical protein n=1 Tax=Bdellovibrio bacteriovorus TaxID=959 RepID=UPI0035A6A15E